MHIAVFSWQPLLLDRVQNWLKAVHKARGRCRGGHCAPWLRFQKILDFLSAQLQWLGRTLAQRTLRSGCVDNVLCICNCSDALVWQFPWQGREHAKVCLGMSLTLNLISGRSTSWERGLLTRSMQVTRSSARIVSRHHCHSGCTEDCKVDGWADCDGSGWMGSPWEWFSQEAVS